MSKIVIISAVQIELAPFLEKTGFIPEQWCEAGKHQVWISFTDVGAVASAYHIQRLVYELKPDLIVQAGIAGHYEGSGLKVGQTVTVIRERLADLGAVIKGHFTEICPQSDALKNPSNFPRLGFPEVSGFTVNTACSPLISQIRAAYRQDLPAVETMEGYSLFYVCLRTETPFLEIRTISNKVSPERDSWDIPLATRNLSDSLIEALEKL